MFKAKMLPRFGGIGISLLLGLAVAGGSSRSVTAKGTNVKSVCITDDHTGNAITYSSTGSYTVCIVSPASMAKTVTGTGVAKTQDNILMLSDNKATIKLSAGFSLNQNSGRASVYIKLASGQFQIFQMTQTAGVARACTCGSD